MRKSFYKFSPFAFLLIALSSCVPTVDPGVPNSLVHKKAGSILTQIDTNAYYFYLASGCQYPLGIESADTSEITYNIKHLNDTISLHTIIAIAKKGLLSGVYFSHLAIVTLKPTIESFRDTLRDTLVVP